MCLLFYQKGCASTARIICAPMAHKFHTCEARSIVPVGKAAGYNGFLFYFALRGEKLCINDSRAAKLPRIRMIYEVLTHGTGRHEMCLPFVCAEGLAVRAAL